MRWAVIRALGAIAGALTLLTVGAAARVPTHAAPSPRLSYIRMFPDGAGWALGQGAVFHTTDGGRRWRAVTPTTRGAPCGEFGPGAQVALNDPWGTDFLDAADAWVTCDVGQRLVVFMTHSSGRQWREGSLRTGLSAALAFADPQRGYLLTVGPAIMDQTAARLYESVDGGVHWRLVSASTFAEGHRPLSHRLSTVGDKTGIAYVSDNTLFVTCSAIRPACIWVSHDGGSTWTRLQWTAKYPGGTSAQGDVTFFPPEFFNGRGGVMPVVAADGALVFYTTGDGGGHWRGGQAVPDTMLPDAYSASFVSPSDGFAIVTHPTGSWSLLATKDGGASWSVLAMSRAVIGRAHPVEVDFSSVEDGWLLLVRPGGGVDLAGTTDGGRAWRVMTPAAS